MGDLDLTAKSQRCLDSFPRSRTYQERINRFPSLIDVMPTTSLLNDLRARIAQIEGVCARHGSLPFGLESLDNHLPGGGLASGRSGAFVGSRAARPANTTLRVAGRLRVSRSAAGDRVAGFFRVWNVCPVVWVLGVRPRRSDRKVRIWHALAQTPSLVR